MEFEMAYEARVAIDRIRFAIKHTEQFAPQTEPMREAGLQLLDALERLETVDRRFQKRSRSGTENGLPSGSGGAFNRDELRSPGQSNGRDRTQRRNVAKSE
jgi:hypothetical protein